MNRMRPRPKSVRHRDPRHRTIQANSCSCVKSQEPRLPEALTSASRRSGQGLALALTLALSPGGCVRLPAAAPPEIRAIAVVSDLSDSRTADACNEAVARVRDTLARDATSPLDVLMLATGDAPGFEPTALVPWTRFAPSDRLYGNPDEEGRERDAFLARLLERCRSAQRTTHRSPIFLAAARGAESLRAHCQELERSGERCAKSPVLALHSDLVETQEPALVRRLRGQKTRRPLPAPPTIDLTGIDVRICGVAGYRGSATRADVVAVWRSVLGEQAVFDPVCPTEGGETRQDKHDAHPTKPTGQ